MLPITDYLISTLHHENPMETFRHLKPSHSRDSLPDTIKYIQSDSNISITSYDDKYIIYNRKGDNKVNNMTYDITSFNGVIFNKDGEVLSIPPRSFATMSYDPDKVIDTTNYDVYIARIGTVLTYYCDIDSNWHISTTRGIKMDTRTLHGTTPLKDLINQIYGSDITAVLDPELSYSFRLSHPDWNPGVKNKKIMLVHVVDRTTFEQINVQEFSNLFEVDEPQTLPISTLMNIDIPDASGVILRAKNKHAKNGGVIDLDLFIENDLMKDLREMIYKHIRRHNSVDVILLHYFICGISETKKNRLIEIYPESKAKFDYYQKSMDKLLDAIIARLKFPNMLIDESDVEQVAKVFVDNVLNQNITSLTSKTLIYNIKDIIMSKKYLSIYYNLWIKPASQ